MLAESIWTPGGSWFEVISKLVERRAEVKKTNFLDLVIFSSEPQTERIKCDFGVQI
jgi:hypothetical protein